MSKYIMSRYEMDKVFNKFKDDERIIKAIDNGWLIYLRPNGFMVIDLNSLQEHYNLKGNVIKPSLSKAKLNKIEQNYCLYN